MKERRLALTFISLGAGVQSSTLALMCAHGEIPMPDCAIFADTRAEPYAVYRWLEWLELKLPFKVHHVSAGNLTDALMDTASGKRYASIPAFLRGDKSDGMGRRQCTAEYKIRPIQKKFREFIGNGSAVYARCLKGISVDEAIRMKPSRVKYIVNEYPLVDRRISRADCLAWMKEHDYPMPPKSSCTFCPYHSDSMWADLKKNDPLAFAEAVLVDKAIRHKPALRGEQFLHKSMKSLDEVGFNENQADMFGNECEGTCGV